VLAVRHEAAVHHVRDPRTGAMIHAHATLYDHAAATPGRLARVDGLDRDQPGHDRPCELTSDALPGSTGAVHGDIVLVAGVQRHAVATLTTTTSDRVALLLRVAPKTSPPQR
jgi:hypothetical protein